MGSCLSRQTGRGRQGQTRSSHQLDFSSVSSLNNEGDSTHHSDLLEHSGTSIHHSNIDNEGYNAMLDCHDKLVTAIATDYLTIAGALLAHRFVSEEVYAKMLLPSSTPNEKATVLAAAIRERMKLAPQHFSELMKILSGHTSTECVVSSLQSAYQGEIGTFTNKVLACIYAL